MLTEKAVRDSAFCSYLWTDVEGNPKRQKEDRNYSDNTIELIFQALSTTVPNKKAFPKKTATGFMVESFSKDFWVTLDLDATSLLLSFKQVRMEKKSGEPWQIRVLREQTWRPAEEDVLQAEKYVQIVLYKAFAEHFKFKIVVETKYKGKESLLTIKPSPEEFREAYAFFDQVRQDAEGERALVARLDRCGNCWFKGCKARQEPVRSNLHSSGKPQIGMI